MEIIENRTNATLTFCTIPPTNYRALTTFQLDRQSYDKLQLPQDYNTIRTLNFALIYVVRKLRGIPVMPLEPQRHTHAYIVVRHLKLVNTKFSSPPLPFHHSLSGLPSAGQEHVELTGGICGRLMLCHYPGDTRKKTTENQPHTTRSLCNITCTWYFPM